MQDLTPEVRARLDAIAARHGVSPDAALALLRAIEVGQGVMAQFNHPELGGMGQWLRTGMVMVGDMFDTGLKRRVGDLSSELAALLSEHVAASTKAKPAQAPPRPDDPHRAGAAADASSQRAPSHSASMQPVGDPLLLIERLAELRAKGVLTDEEFLSKKAELLQRL